SNSSHSLHVVSLPASFHPSPPLFFFNPPPPPDLYTLSLHDALPISPQAQALARAQLVVGGHRIEHPHLMHVIVLVIVRVMGVQRSEEHTSELQSRSDLVCRLLLEKKKNKNIWKNTTNS